MNQRSQKIISAFLIISILMPAILFAVPHKAGAQGILDSPILTGIGDGLLPPVPVKDSEAVLLARKRNFLQKLILGENQSINTIKGKEWAAALLREVLRTAARRLLAQMTQATVNWINTGFHGQPLFLERPGAFFKDIAKSEIKDLVNIIGYNSSSFPFGKSFAMNIINGYKSTFAQNAQYSLSKVINDPVLLNNYRNNFSTGGWDAFLLNTQYPQNNYIGSQIMYSDYLARQLSGTDDSPANLIKDTLKQGQGFLSPQTCPTNPNYNNLKNQFQKPSFKCSVKVPEPCPRVAGPTDPDTGVTLFLYDTSCQGRYEVEQKNYDRQCSIEKAAFTVATVCPGGLVNTTPGSVVASQIMKAMVGPYETTSLAAAMGNNLSAIFDALLNKFMSSGLNALSSKLSGGGNNNANNNNDNFDYFGNTLGSPTSTTTTNGPGFDWNGTPDQIIVLSTFKQDVQGAIDNANKELILIDNNDANNPGILQKFAEISQKTQELDMCLPGPDLGWQDRTDKEAQRAIDDEATYNALQSAADAFKEWVTGKMNTELPGSTNYLNTVNSIKTIQTQNEELVVRKNTIIDTLSGLGSMQGELIPITVDPARGSIQEATEARLKQKLDGMLVNISNTGTVNDMKNKLADTKYKLTNLDSLITKCNSERTAKGWSNPGGADSVLNNLSTDTEKFLFCSSFINPALSCDVIYSASTADYKNDSPRLPVP